MAQPTQSDVHVNRPLTNISIATIQAAENFVATQTFPLVPSGKQSDAYFVYDNAYWNSDEMQLRGPASESVGSGYKVDGTTTYFCDPYAIHKDIPDQVRANADIPINLDREATDWVTLKALIKRERLFASTFMKSGVWTNYDFTGVTGSPSTNQVKQWDQANSTPIEDVWNAKSAILQATGFEPNVLTISYPVYKVLVNHAEFVDRVKYGQTWGAGGTQPAKVALAAMAQLFEVDRVLVCKAIYNSANEGAATANHQFIIGKVAGLFYAPSSPGLMTPSAGYIFSWTGWLGAGPDGQRIKRFRMEHLEADRVEIGIAFSMKLISVNLGAFWTSVVG